MDPVSVKQRRVLTALRDRKEPDRVPLTDFYWTDFYRNWLREMGLPEGTDIYEYYDLDVKLVSPNLDPKVESCRIIEQTTDYVTFKSGFGCTVKKDFSAPMPLFLDFEVNSADEYTTFTFENPRDNRRYYEPRCDILNNGDSFGPLPSYVDVLEQNQSKFAIFGSICEPHEAMWRIRGTEGLLMDLALYPDQVKAFAERTTDFMLEAAERQTELADLTGIIIWGDVAYDKGMFFSPDTWWTIYYPCVKRLCDFIREKGLLAIYHGCGKSLDIFEGLIEAGVQVYHPLEAKAGMDPVILKNRYGDRIAFYGGIDMRLLGEGSWEDIEREVLYKLQTGLGGGYMPASDHSVASNINPRIYDRMMSLLKERGRYPLSLDRVIHGDYL